MEDKERFVNDKVKLFDIARSIDEIEGKKAGMSLERFAKETDVKDEVAYQLREIGIAARTLSEEFKVNFGDIDWDVLANLQFATWDQEIEIDPHSLWYIIENDLPSIKEQIWNITNVLEDKSEDSFFY